jgi:hypothetical protein
VNVAPVRGDFGGAQAREGRHVTISEDDDRMATSDGVPLQVCVAHASCVKRLTELVPTKPAPRPLFPGVPVLRPCSSHCRLIAFACRAMIRPSVARPMRMSRTNRAYCFVKVMSPPRNAVKANGERWTRRVLRKTQSSLIWRHSSDGWLASEGRGDPTLGCRFPVGHWSTRLAEPVCGLISQCSVRTQVSTRIMKRDWFAILVVVIEIAVILTAGALFYAALQN